MVDGETRRCVAYRLSGPLCSWASLTAFQAVAQLQRRGVRCDHPQDAATNASAEKTRVLLRNQLLEGRLPPGQHMSAPWWWLIYYCPASTWPSTTGKWGSSSWPVTLPYNVTLLDPLLQNVLTPLSTLHGFVIWFITPVNIINNSLLPKNPMASGKIP